MSSLLGRHVGTAGRTLLLAPLAVVILFAAAGARGDDTAPEADSDSTLHVRYAEARLRLARLDLERAVLVNERVEGQVSETDLRRLKARARVLESLVEATRLHPHGNGLESHKARARAAVEVARDDLESVGTPRADNAMEKILFERYRSRLEIAKLRLALLEDPSNVPSPFDQMQLQLDQLADHVLDLLDQIENQNTIIPPR